MLTVAAVDCLFELLLQVVQNLCCDCEVTAMSSMCESICNWIAVSTDMLDMSGKL